MSNVLNSQEGKDMNVVVIDAFSYEDEQEMSNAFSYEKKPEISNAFSYPKDMSDEVTDTYEENFDIQDELEEDVKIQNAFSYSEDMLPAENDIYEKSDVQNERNENVEIMDAFSYTNINNEVETDICSERLDMSESTDVTTSISENKESAVSVQNTSNQVVDEGKKESQQDKVVEKPSVITTKGEGVENGKFNFTLKLRSKIINIIEVCEAEKINVEYEFEVQVYGENFLVCVQANELENCKWVKRITQGRAYVSDNKLFQQYIHQVLEEGLQGVPVKYIYASTRLEKTTGW